MIKASSFEKNVYAKFKLIIEIQKTLSNLTNDNIDTIFKEISKKKEIIENEMGIPIFAQCLNDVVNFRPKIIENIVDFIVIIKGKTEESKFSAFITKVVEVISTKEKLTSSDLFYMRILYEKEIITIESVINQIKAFIELNEKSMKSFLCVEKRIENVIKWFYFEIKDKIDFIDVNIYARETDIKIPMLKTGYNTDYIAEIIKNDDIDSFISIVSKKGNEFYLNQTIKSTGFERCDLLLTDTSFIEYSAFFNSIKIFKFLYLNKAELTSDNKYSLLDYDICGGSIEIIHILEQNEFNLNEGIPAAIKYYQNDIFSFIIDNYSKQDTFNDTADNDMNEDDADEVFKNNFAEFVSVNYSKKYNFDKMLSQIQIITLITFLMQLLNQITFCHCLFCLQKEFQLMQEMKSQRKQFFIMQLKKETVLS